ncbi:uncharacterized protein [Nicotiana tomentosiformis]|uniref:uncharacterized protein n=1 Tax=Nicotiana tomentosiformis TaxID=4098 RepID=UPI00388C4A2E
MLVHDYEFFRMKEGESIEEMFATFSKIISDLKAFGKPYSSGDQVRKLLRSLPTTWQTKVVTLESQDLNKLSYDELRGELIAFEKTHIKKANQEEKKKTVAFKATTEREDNDIDDDPESLQEEIAMVSRNMDGLMRRYKNTRRGRIPPWRTRQYNEQDKNDGKCYECGRFGHVQAECPDLKRKGAGQMRTLQMTNAKMTMRTVSWSEVKQARNCKCNSMACANTPLIVLSSRTRRLTSQLEKDQPEHSPLVLTQMKDPKMDQDLRVTTVTKVDINILFVDFVNQMSQDGFGNPKPILSPIILTNKDPSKLVYLKGSDNYVLQEHHRRSSKGKWYLDSACPSHMIGDKNMFKEVTKIDGGSVKFGDDSKGKIVGIETVPFNKNCDITEVYLVDGLNYSLLSISQLCDSGYEVKFKKTGCAIEDETGKIILPSKRYGNVYILDGFENIDGHICLTSISDDPWLWHKKLGHASMHLIEKLSKHDLVIGLPKLNFSRNHVCDACQIGKQTRNSFKNNDIVSTSKPLQLLHMDLFEPTRTASIGGKLYAFVIVDDYSRFAWVIFLSHKDEALKNLRYSVKRSK